jgi:hypothetical protein
MWNCVVSWLFINVLEGCAVSIFREKGGLYTLKMKREGSFEMGCHV